MSKNLISEIEELNRSNIIKGCIIQFGDKFLIIHREH